MTDEPPHREPHGRDRRAARAAELQDRFGGTRTRTVDDHMFAVGRGAWYPCTFRLQLFTAPGTRPVAVAVQARNEGMSLTNGRERFIKEIWRRHCPDEPEPPLWIDRQLLPGWDDFTAWDPRPGRSVDAEPHAVTFAGARRYPVTLEQIRALVGATVDGDRGDGFVPRPPEPDVQIRFSIVWVSLLPRPNPFRAPECMPAGITPARRIVRQILPRRGGSSCCWYHQGDWRKVSRSAIKLLRRANRAGIDHDELRGYFQEQAGSLDLSGWERDALLTLACSADAIQLQHDGLRRGYINGQHRAQALLDGGAKRTIAARLIYPELVRDPGWPHNAPTAAERGLPVGVDDDEDPW